jgi:hypothetical protein
VRCPCSRVERRTTSLSATSANEAPVKP